MRHASRKATKAQGQQFSLAKALFASGKGSHSIRAVRAVQSSGGDAVVLGLDPEVAEKINEIAPQSRRSIREASRAAERRSHILASASLAALVGTAATAMAFANTQDRANTLLANPATTTTQIKRINDVNTASRSDARAELNSSVTQQSTNEGAWGLSNSDSSLDAKLMNRNNANNPVVSALIDQDDASLPAGYNPNHDIGTGTNNYPWGQCTWYAYQRRAELGLPTSGNFGNGGAWAASASALGYWVDNVPRHTGDAVVFTAGQANADSTYGHVAVLEKINADGSIEISESNAKGLGVVSSRTFSADQAAQLQYIHY
jgi:surface antigen